MRDLVAHSRSPAAFLVYLQLYCLSRGSDRPSAAISHGVLAELIGLSKRSVHLVDRKLLRSHKARPTSVPVYTVLTPWLRRPKAPDR